MEFCKIKGVTEERRKALGIDLIGGRMNSIELSVEFLSAPPPDQLLEEFKATFEQAA